jgi:hypothetical protein
MRCLLFLSILVCFNAYATSEVIDYSRLDPDHLIPSKVLQKTYQYYVSTLKRIKNQRYMGIIDFKLHNSKERFYIVDMESGGVEKFLVAHGKKSDPKFSGYAAAFSNVIDSQMSSLGFYLTAESYDGVHGHSLRLDGLTNTNSNSRARGIVIHGADYVNPGEKIGRSFGCPAVEMRYHDHIINELKDGALIYASFE